MAEQMDFMHTDQDIETDGFLGFSSRKDVEGNHPPINYDSLEYKMDHKNAGLAVIFNQLFANDPNHDTREGSQADCDSLQKALEVLHLKVKICKDYTLAQINQKVNKVAKYNHTKNDCLVIVIMSHGNEQFIQSKDEKFELESITEKFTADNCKTLAGKPKLFFVQACRGNKEDKGAHVTVLHDRTDKSDDKRKSYFYKIPNFADFLVAYSTVPGYFSYRHPANGTWFIQTLCKELEENGKKHELMKILTMVNRRVAFEKQTKNDEKKQIPCITSMLTGGLKFNDKDKKN